MPKYAQFSYYIEYIYIYVECPSVLLFSYNTGSTESQDVIGKVLLFFDMLCLLAFSC